MGEETAEAGDGGAQVLMGTQRIELRPQRPRDLLTRQPPGRCRQEHREKVASSWGAPDWPPTGNAHLEAAQGHDRAFPSRLVSRKRLADVGRTHPAPLAPGSVPVGSMSAAVAAGSAARLPAAAIALPVADARSVCRWLNHASASLKIS